MKPTLNQTGEYTIPWPRPWRATLGWIFVGLLAVGGTVGLRFWWEHKANQLWNDEVNRLRGAGEKVTRSDFQPPLISHDLNAAEYLRAAWLKADSNDPLQKAEVIALVRKAASLSQADWKTDISGSFFSWRIPSRREPDLTSAILLDATRDAHAAGNDAEAVQLALDQICMIRHMYTMLPGMSAILSTDTLESNLQRQVKTILPDIRIGSEDGNASPSQIRKLIDELISDDRMLLMLDQVWQGERILAAELEHELDGAEPLMWWPIRPAIRMTSYRMMLHANAAGEQFKRSPTPYSGPSAFPSEPTFVPPLYRLTHLDSQIQFFSIQWTRLLAGDRSVPKALGILLAIQLYRFDHGGALPESLEEMVPAYFAEVPIDPESAARFQYARDGLPFSEGQPVVFLNPGNMTIPTTAPQVSPRHSQFKFWTAEPLSTEPASDE